ncbi:MAG: tetratricopeptide repeat protein, partial [Candidatus Eiseniibacteriota bacterium]
MIQIRRSGWVLLGTFLLGVMAIPVAASAGSQKAEPQKAEAEKKGATPSLKETGVAFESARLLSGADRVSALEDLGRTTASVLKGDLSKDEAAAATALSAQIRYELNDYRGAAEEYRRAAGRLSGGPFVDDAEFASIRAMEEAGQDVEAAGAWESWQKQYPQSPLRGEVHLAQAWNALRRGDTDLAGKQLAALTQGSPWYDRDARVALAKATLLYTQGKPVDALGVLGPKVTGASAVYLRGLCYRAKGSVLQSAAAFQEITQRYPDSPLRDPAMLAKADAFLIARDYRSASEEFSSVAKKAKDPRVVAEAEVRAAGSLFLAGAADSALGILKSIVARYPDTDVAARAQFLVGEVLAGRGQNAEAIVEMNKVLKQYFQHSVAASAQYRV